FPERVTEFKIEVDLTADLTVYNPFDFFLEPDAEHWPMQYPAYLQDDLAVYCKVEPAGPLLKAWLAQVNRQPRPMADTLVALNQRLASEIEYVVRLEPGVQTPEETLQAKRGSCRDSGWLLVNILRHLGLAARFVSGYLIQLKPDLDALDGPSGTENDFTDLHAWAEVYLPGAGWIGLDATSGLLCGESHIPLAGTPHYSNAAPIVGSVSEAEVTFGFAMDVQRIQERPRVTLPFSDEAWNKLVAVGDVVDAQIQEQDIRLTMGGEPTFVSIDDYEADEWNTGAQGPNKERLADQLLHRLYKRFAPGGVLHHGQGKWYPGETLPRWTYSVFWRVDGEPLWNHPEYFVVPDTAAVKASVKSGAVKAAPGSSKNPKELTESIETVREFAIAVAQSLQVDTDNVLPVFEDPVHWLRKENELPVNVDPEDSKLEDPEQRARMASVFSRGLNTPVGFALPVQRWQARASKWRSERWDVRTGKMIAAPGDSALGYRLPLGSLPWVPPAQYPYIHPTDPSVEQPDLPKSAANTSTDRVHSIPVAGVPTEAHGRNEQVAGGPVIRTAVTFEQRDGRLYVFMPPVEAFEDYLDLLGVVEQAASKLSIPLRLEGYAPPRDPRINMISVAPDPGVIEVNIHPASTWRECVDITQAVYEEARQTRLAAEKFMLDGRHAGTGGGNHVVVGGAKPNDSPFLRRPDLLKSLLLYWQHHPSLSYMFSGLFIGPTSQAPRVDEARHDSLYELELAMAQVPAPGEGKAPPPWLVDRLFRNLLIDVSGNTHRSEICIDKMFSPDGPTGRLGLVEFRGFEMPPDPRMSLAQQLLIRGLILKFWRSPLSGGFARWGTALHDRFMLPHFIWEDFQQVVGDLQALDSGFDLEWYRAQYEFRFPFCGEVSYQGVRMQLRQALEPWHVLGETGAIGGTVRYVDSSLERLQVLVDGLDPARYAVSCNGRTVPMQPTGVAGQFVGGVRFKAWQFAEGLHPHLKVNAPLTFDLVDLWNQRSAGGCVYHVAHPGGRNYETFPVNANEAQARRLVRFDPNGHT
ncbi:MAG: transglutaminase family protein, partial [Burkholderiaceae bacterium]